MFTPIDTLTFIVQSILPGNTEIDIKQKEENEIQILEITAPEELKGRLIGKAGRIIKAIRTIIAVSFPQQRILVKIID